MVLYLKHYAPRAFFAAKRVYLRLTRKTRAYSRERNRGRREIRAFDCREVTPEQVGFPGARLMTRLKRRVARNRSQNHRDGVSDQPSALGAAGRGGLDQAQAWLLGDREPPASCVGRVAGRRPQPGAPCQCNAGVANASPAARACGASVCEERANPKNTLLSAAFPTMLDVPQPRPRTPPRFGLHQSRCFLVLTNMKTRVLWFSLLSSFRISFLLKSGS